MVLIPIYLGRIQELIPGLSGLYIAKIAMILSILLLFLTAKNVLNDDFKVWQVPQIKYVLLILACIVASIPFSMWRGGSVDALINHLKLLLFIWIVIQGINSTNDIQKISWSYAFTLLALCLFSLLAPKLTAGRISVSGTYDSNDLALVMVMSVPILFYMMESHVGLKKLVLLVTLFLMTIVVLKTGSRGGLLALISVTGIILYRKGIRYTAIRIPVLIIILLVALSYTSSDMHQRYSDFFAINEDYNNTSQGGRLEIWKRGLTLMVNHPLLGTGAGSYAVADGTTHEWGKWSAAHNSFIQIGVELGIIALIFQIKLIQISLQAVRRQVDGYPLQWLPKGVEVGLYGYCVGAFFLSWAFSSLFYFFIALSIVYVKVTIPVAESAENTVAAETELPWRVADPIK